MPSRTTACRARRRQQGRLLASSWRPRGRCPVAPARSEAAANAHLVVGDVSQDVVEIPTGLTPRAQVLQPRRLITASPVIPIGVPPLVVRSVQHTVGRSARQSGGRRSAAGITARPASAGAGHRTAEYRRNNEPVLRPLFGRCDVHRSSTGNESRSPRPPLPHWRPGRSSGQRKCGPLALIVEGTRRRRRASNTVRSGRSGKITSSGTNAQRGRPESGHLSGTRPRVQPRLARWPPRALTRWCVARGAGAARCAGRRCGPGGAARHAASPVRAAPDRRPAGRRPRAVPVR